MLPRDRTIKIAIAAACCIAAISAARAMTATTDSCAQEVVDYADAQAALAAAQTAEIDAQYAVQEAEEALDAAYGALIACGGSGGGSGYMEAPRHELAVSILED